MNCPKCQSAMVKARATNFGPEYDYCRTCKKELAEIQKEFRDPGPGIITVPAGFRIDTLDSHKPGHIQIQPYRPTFFQGPPCMCPAGAVDPTCPQHAAKQPQLNKAKVACKHPYSSWNWTHDKCGLCGLTYVELIKKGEHPT